MCFLALTECGIAMLVERKKRSIGKAVSWRVLATLTTMTIFYVLTGKLTLSLAAGGLEVFFKMFLYYSHERVWNKVNWGKSRYRPHVLWFTGLPKSGKSTLAKAVSEEFKKMNVNFEQMDGETLRHIFPKTGFSRHDRNIHIRRVGFLAGLLERRGVCTICSFISPYREARQFVRQNIKNFVEVYLGAPVEVCEKRDSEGLYEKARRGEIKQFTGIDDPYEEPNNPELVLDTANLSVEDCKRRILSYLKKRKYIS